MKILFQFRPYMLFSSMLLSISCKIFVTFSCCFLMIVWIQFCFLSRGDSIILDGSYFISLSLSISCSSIESLTHSFGFYVDESCNVSFCFFLLDNCSLIFFGVGSFEKTGVISRGFLFFTPKIPTSSRKQFCLVIPYSTILLPRLCFFAIMCPQVLTSKDSFIQIGCPRSISKRMTPRDHISKDHIYCLGNCPAQS